MGIIINWQLIILRKNYLFIKFVRTSQIYPKSGRVEILVAQHFYIKSYKTGN